MIQIYFLPVNWLLHENKWLSNQNKSSYPWSCWIMSTQFPQNCYQNMKPISEVWQIHLYQRRNWSFVCISGHRSVIFINLHASDSSQKTGLFSSPPIVFFNWPIGVASLTMLVHSRTDRTDCNLQQKSNSCQSV